MLAPTDTVHGVSKAHKVTRFPRNKYRGVNINKNKYTFEHTYIHKIFKGVHDVYL